MHVRRLRMIARQYHQLRMRTGRDFSHVLEDLMRLRAEAEARGASRDDGMTTDDVWAVIQAEYPRGNWSGGNE